MAKVKCGPLPADDHNISHVDLEVLTASLVGLAGECTRIVLGLGFVHHEDPTVLEEELEEVLELGTGIAVRADATFELAGVPPERGEEWPAWPETGVIKSADRPPRLQGVRGNPVLAKKTSKVQKRNRFKRKRPPPRFDASRPPVYSFAMLTKPENLRGALTFKKIPYMRYEQIPDKWRWRPYCYLTGVPHFAQASPDTNHFWRHRTRYFR